ncbi:MAG: hypothetical protein JSV78_06405 [Phycisphaerales bacterium]|nr:MAG: hypothetical protein JSV78_06405 [Phycisphaerales bacterium]
MGGFKRDFSKVMGFGNWVAIAGFVFAQMTALPGLGSMTTAPAGQPTRCCCCEVGKCPCGCAPVRRGESEPEPVPQVCACDSVPMLPPASGFGQTERPTRLICVALAAGTCSSAEADCPVAIVPAAHSPPSETAFVSTFVLLI